MPVPKPKPGEDEGKFMGRCVPMLTGEGKPQDQAVAICLGTFRQRESQVLAEAFKLSRLLRPGPANPSG